ncbi:folliculin-like [Ylistrum balloti]|uniref:folliculin-like n=1 Tax=Ylistrum balloti TaxID=509963 RepID=UPI00290587D2|nr:folliculin-like [Ylistrum balloti]
MNAIISLCHFCELHGPQVLFCTQPNHPQELGSGDSVVGVAEEHYNTMQLLLSRTQGEGGAQGLKSPVTEPSTPTPSFANHCEGCYSVKPGFVSHDDDVKVSYVSSRQPHNREVFSMIRQACLRSLSGEVCPGTEGPIFFGNDQQGHVISYSFHIRDFQARGFQRRYSIIIVMMDKIYLLNSWPFLVKNLKIVVEHLQEKAQKVYDVEQAKSPKEPNKLVSFHINPKPARSLMELTEDRNIFKILHVSFVWILKACGNRITESLLEGPPTEDSIIDMEKQEETEEGFIKLFKKSDTEEDEEEEKVTEKEEEEEQEESSSVSAVQNIRYLLRSLGAKKFHILAHHAVIGNQVIVRGALKSAVKSVLSALKCIVPKGCCRVVSYSQDYEASWKCNFLGLAPDVHIPNHIMATEMFVLVEVISPVGDNTDPSTTCAIDLDQLRECDFSLASPTSLPEKGPTVLTKMEMALKNENLTNEVLEQYLICLKEEWMNKVKVLFKFTKAGGSRSEEDTKKLLQVVGAQEEDKQLLKFWMTGLSCHYKTHILSTTKSHH